MGNKGVRIYFTGEPGDRIVGQFDRYGTVRIFVDTVGKTCISESFAHETLNIYFGNGQLRRIGKSAAFSQYDAVFGYNAVTSEYHICR